MQKFLRKIIYITLCFALVVSCSGCGNKISGYGVTVIESLKEEDYTICFRNDDPLYFYVVSAIEVLTADGTIPELAHKWLGDNLLKFEPDLKALEDMSVPEGKVFRVGINEDAFPMAYLSDGGYWGLDVQCAEAVCDLLKWDLQLIPIENGKIYEELYSGNIDCAWGGLVLSEKDIADKTVSIYGPYITNEIVVAARTGSAVYNKARLKGKTMAMRTKQDDMDILNTDRQLADNLGQITRLAKGTTECFEFLYAGKADAILTGSLAVYYYNCH